MPGNLKMHAKSTKVVPFEFCEQLGGALFRWEDCYIEDWYIEDCYIEDCYIEDCYIEDCYIVKSYSGAMASLVCLCWALACTMTSTVFGVSFQREYSDSIKLRVKGKGREEKEDNAQPWGSPVGETLSSRLSLLFSSPSPSTLYYHHLSKFVRLFSTNETE